MFPLCVCLFPSVRGPWGRCVRVLLLLARRPCLVCKHRSGLVRESTVVFGGPKRRCQCGRWADSGAYLTPDRASSPRDQVSCRCERSKAKGQRCLQGCGGRTKNNSRVRHWLNNSPTGSNASWFECRRKRSAGGQPDAGQVRWWQLPSPPRDSLWPLHTRRLPYYPSLLFVCQPHQLSDPAARRSHPGPSGTPYWRTSRSAPCTSRVGTCHQRSACRLDLSATKCRPRLAPQRARSVWQSLGLEVIHSALSLDETMISVIEVYVACRTKRRPERFLGPVCSR